MSKLILPSDFLDHREEMIKEMIETIDLSNGGTVLVYNKNFEYFYYKYWQQQFAAPYLPNNKTQLKIPKCKQNKEMQS